VDLLPDAPEDGTSVSIEISIRLALTLSTIRNEFNEAETPVTSTKAKDRTMKIINSLLMLLFATTLLGRNNNRRR